MPRNLYLILGIRSDADLGQIKAAYRQRALELHPDRSGLSGGPFIEAQEAYATLSDPERRHRYDEDLRQMAARRQPGKPAPEPLVRERPKAEPFRPDEMASAFHDVSPADSFESYRPSFDELFKRWWSNLDSVSRPKSEHLESLTVEVIVWPEEAALGGVVRVAIPARATCPACGGHGVVGEEEIGTMRA